MRLHLTPGNRLSALRLGVSHGAGCVLGAAPGGHRLTALLGRGMTADMESKIRYEDIVVHIRASDCFRNAVVYTPHDRPGFCIEPQTCATNFINMHAQGLVDESGLMVLPAGRTFACWVDMTVEKRTEA